jgi:hypothetical protein
MSLPLERLKPWLVPLALTGWFGLWLLVLGALAAARLAEPLAPAQPIAFPHTVHAGRLMLECRFCHAMVDRSPRATVPALSVCMTCHATIAVDRPGVKALRGYVERREPIAWNRVHLLPEFIGFTHKRHVKAGVACATCHGDVAAMARVKKVRPLTMGWCVTCHRTRGASTDCATCHV